ncbi:MAG: adenylate/guanylate cyclase domain-containing protein [Cyclobacteriaceae bacterium]
MTENLPGLNSEKGKHASHVDLQSIGEEITATILFIDLQGYTSFTARNLPQNVIHVLRNYYNFAGSIIKKNNGHIIDYFGDGILSVFGMNHDSEHRLHAVNSGLEIVKNFGEFCEGLKPEINEKFKVRLGAHTGKVIISTLGYEGMEKLAAVGDAVNVAHRIEEANRELLTSFLVSEDLYAKTAGLFKYGRYYHIPIKGKSGSQLVYEVHP